MAKSDTDKDAPEVTPEPEMALDSPPAEKKASGDIVIVGDDWLPTGKTIPKPKDGYPLRLSDPDEPGVAYERVGTDEKTKAPLYRKVV